MRVLHIGKFYPPVFGGMERHLRDLCTEAAREVDVRVLVANRDGGTVSEQCEGVTVTRLGMLMEVSGAQICPDLIGAIRDCRPDIVHLHWPNPPGVAAYLASRHRGPLVITYHSDVIRQRIAGALFSPFLNMALRRAGAIIASSPNYVESSPVLSRYREKCHVIPFGIRLDQYASVNAREVAEIRAQVEGALVLGVGRLVYYKGFDLLIRAMREVDATLILIGNGPMRASLEETAREAGVSGRIRFLGAVEDAVPYFHAADVFVLPAVARSEAFGLVQLEAMACGKPVVNTRVDSGVPFVSRDGETGLTVEPGSVEQLAWALQRLTGDALLRCRYGCAARRRMEAEFRVEIMARRTLDLYRSLIGPGSNGLRL